VTAIVDRVLTTVDRNPELVKSIGKAVRDVGSGTGHTLGESGEAVEDIGEGTEDALASVGQGAGQAVEGIGQGTGEAAGNLDQVLANAGQAVGQAGQGAGQAAGALGGGGGGGDGGGGGGLEDVAGLIAGDHPTRAKEAAKLTVKELGVSAKEKFQEIGERRRHRKAEEYDATDRAYEIADELGVDLDEVEGSGSEGRITVRDVQRAATE
jgi:pyruvate/2-oxoglutarate dehydrogenase complex dihydrolipoamide acyltransferase (E2) component